MVAYQALHPWHSMGKNTGVGCHFLLQCRHPKLFQSCPTETMSMCDPTDSSPPFSSVHRILQARKLKWVAISFSTLMEEREKELRSLLMKIKVESENFGLILNIQKTKIMASGPITSWQIDEETTEAVTYFILGGLQNHCRWLL